MKPLAPGIVAYKGFFSTVKVGMVRCFSMSVLQPVHSGSLYLSVRSPRLEDWSQNEGFNGVERFKPLQSFGNVPKEENFTINREGEPKITATALDHLKNKVEIPESVWHQIAKSKEHCVNTAPRGKRVEWFPVEMLEITKHQPYGGRLPGDATASMITLD